MQTLPTLFETFLFVQSGKTTTKRNPWSGRKNESDCSAAVVNHLCDIARWGGRDEKDFTHKNFKTRVTVIEKSIHPWRTITVNRIAEKTTTQNQIAPTKIHHGSIYFFSLTFENEKNHVEKPCQSNLFITRTVPRKTREGKKERERETD